MQQLSPYAIDHATGTKNNKIQSQDSKIELESDLITEFHSRLYNNASPSFEDET